MEAPSAEGQEAWVGVSDLAVIHHVTSGKSLPLSGPQCPFCQAGATITTSHDVEVNKENEYIL